MRTFEFSEGASNKFWNITLSGNSFTVNFGKIGTAGQSQTKSFADDAAAKKEHDKLVAEKVKKGYQETTKGGAPAPTALQVPLPLPPAPAPAAAPKPAPAAAPPAQDVRTFEFSDATSHKFWNVRRDGTQLRITYGRIGTDGQTQLKTLSSEDAAKAERDKLVAEKVKKGYRETTPAAKKAPTNEREALEAALVDNPDDLASHMAYADYLTEQGDPLGDFIRVQLALEDEKKTTAERKKLAQQEKKLLDAHARAWLGDLAPFLFGEHSLADEGEEEDEYERLEVKYAFRRGWLDSLEVGRCHLPFTRTLARAPQVRLLRQLVITNTRYLEGNHVAEPSDGAPEDCDHPVLYPLVRAEHLGNVRTFILGEVTSPEEDERSLDYGPSCHTSGEGAVGVVKRMPRLEELRLPAHRVDTKQLFALKTLHNLRILQVDHCHDYPLETLAKNPSLGNLTHFLCWPHGLEPDDPHAYIRAAGVKAVVTSPHLKSLTHLRLRCSDMGDKGAREIAASGILKRLKVLDLRHGNVSDKGAKALADAMLAGTSLEMLDLYNNALTDEGIAALKATKVKFRAEGQHALVADDDDEKEYLWVGDPE